jgi:hypothetical protein
MYPLAPVGRIIAATVVLLLATRARNQDGVKDVNDAVASREVV